MASAPTSARRGGTIIDAGDASANITSDVVDVEGCALASVHLYSASATRAGSVAVDLSNDLTARADPDNANWVQGVGVYDASGSLVTSSTVSASTAYDEMLTLIDLGARFMRVRFTFTSGTGTLDAIAATKARGRY